MYVHFLPRALLQSLGALHLAYRLLYLDLQRTLLGLGARWKSEYKGGVPTLSPVFKFTSLLLLPSVSPSKASVGILTPSFQDPGSPSWREAHMKAVLGFSQWLRARQKAFSKWAYSFNI